MKITKDNLDDVFKSKPCSVDTMKLKGYRLIDTLFVDSSGFGLESEPALTASEFEREFRKYVDLNGVVYTSLVGVGQFQVYVGIFAKAKRVAKKVAHETLQFKNDNGDTVIRYHDTNILTFKKDSEVIELDNGGYETVTTKKRLNQYLPNRYYVKQANYQWYVVDNLLKKSIFFDNKLTLPV